MNKAMKGVRLYESQRLENGEVLSRTEMITEEKPLRILINKEPFTVTMRTPGLDKELVLGLLYNEDVIRSVKNVTIEYAEEDTIDTAKVYIPESDIKDGYMNARNFLSVSSCGVCGKTSLPLIEGSIKSKNESNPTLILEGLATMRGQQSIFEQTGGCHAASVMDKHGKIIITAEDIGRHNAVDKVIGSLLLTNQLKEADTLLVSGRISYEIVIKCFRAKISTLAAVSAPSSLAIDYAKELGIRLYAFCRDNRITKFA